MHGDATSSITAAATNGHTTTPPYLGPGYRHGFH